MAQPEPAASLLPQAPPKSDLLNDWSLRMEESADGAKPVAAELVPGLHLFGREGLAAAPLPSLPARLAAARCGGGLLAVVDEKGLLRLFQAGGKPAFAPLPGTGSALALVDLECDHPGFSLVPSGPGGYFIPRQRLDGLAERLRGTPLGQVLADALAAFRDMPSA